MTAERTTSEITQDLRDMAVDLARWLNPAANLLFDAADKLDDLRAEADKQKTAAFACQHEVNRLRAQAACGDASHVHIGPYCTPVASEQQVKA